MNTQTIEQLLAKRVMTDAAFPLGHPVCDKVTDEPAVYFRRKR